MANVYFDDKFNVCAVEDNPEYLYVDDVDAFIKECGNMWIFDYVDRIGVYYWNNDNEAWSLANTEIDKKIREIVNLIGGITRVKEGVSVGWNIIITLDSGEVIKTNSEPVDINEVQEAINVMLKPSFFGKRIKKFEIVAE